MAFSEKASSPTVPTNHDPNRLDRQVASVPQTMRRRRRKGKRISDASHVVVEVHGNGNVAEGEGFEPPKACTLVVFKTGFFKPPEFAIVRRRSPCSGRRSFPSANVRRRSPSFAAVAVTVAVNRASILAFISASLE